MLACPSQLAYGSGQYSEQYILSPQASGGSGVTMSTQTDKPGDRLDEQSTAESAPMRSGGAGGVGDPLADTFHTPQASGGAHVHLRIPTAHLGFKVFK